MPARTLGFALAVALNATFGDPPNVAHPVAWFGRLAGRVESTVPASSAHRGGAGLASTVALASLAAAVAELASRQGRGSPVVEGALLWLAFSRRSLFVRGIEVADALDTGDLAEARRLLAYHLVSRDTGDLDVSEVAGAAIESIAENLSDSVVAPWCWYAVGGAWSAWGYRALNTLDAMWGYRTPRYLDFGRAAARADDLVNLMPSRIAALAIVAAARAGKGDAASAWRIWRRDARLTSSPNAGHPMSAMAGALGVQLTKRGEYRLGGDGRAPRADDLRRAVAIARAASWGVAAALALTMMRRTR